MADYFSPPVTEHWPLPQPQSPAFKSLTDYEYPLSHPTAKGSLSPLLSLTIAVCADKNKCLEGNLTGTSHLFSKTIAVAFL